MLEKKYENVNTRIPVELKKKTQKQAIDLDCDYKDLVQSAIEHYSEHIENNELDLTESN